MNLTYHDRSVYVDDRWAAVASQMGMEDFALSEDGFTETLRPSRSPVPFAKRTSAIYFWRAENGEAYVGQALDVQSRLRQHYKNHRDLVSAAYLPVAPENLNKEERRLVSIAESNFRMRNIKLVKDSVSFRPLDAFLSMEQQSAFIEAGNLDGWLTEVRREFPILETRGRVKHAEFLKDAEIYEFLQAAVSQFVHSAIPMPNLTENRFWSVTYLGSSQPNLIRINVGQQEVFTLLEDKNRFLVRVVCPTKLSRDFNGPLYETNSYASFLDWDAATHLLGSTKKMRPMRQFVVWLARHTTPLNNRSHSPWLHAPEMTH